MSTKNPIKRRWDKFNDWAAKQGAEGIRKRMGAKSIDAIALGIVEGISAIIPPLGLGVLALEYSRHRARQLGKLPDRYTKPKNFYGDMDCEIRDITSHILNYNLWKSRAGFRMNLKYKTAKDYVMLPDWVEKTLHEIAYLPDELRQEELIQIYRTDHRISPEIAQFLSKPLDERERIPRNERSEEQKRFDDSIKYLNNAAGEKIGRMKGWFSVIYKKENKAFNDFYGLFDVSEKEDEEEKKLQKRKIVSDLKRLKDEAIKEFKDFPQNAHDQEIWEGSIQKITPNMIMERIKDRKEGNPPDDKQIAKVLDFMWAIAPKITPEEVAGYKEASIKAKQKLDKALFAIINSKDPYERTQHKALRDLMTKMGKAQLAEKTKLKIEEENDKKLIEIWLKEMEKIEQEVEDVLKRKRDKLKLATADTIREIMGQNAQVSQIGNGWIAYNTETGVAHVWGVDPKEYGAAFQKFEKFAHDRGDFWRGFVECEGPPEFRSAFETYCRERSIRSAQLFGHPHSFLLSEITQEVIGNAEANHSRGALVIRVVVVDEHGKPRYEKDGKLMIMNIPIWNKQLCQRNSISDPKSMMRCFRSDDYWPETSDSCVVTGYSSMNGAIKTICDEVVAYIPMDENGQIINDMAFHARLEKAKDIPRETRKIIEKTNMEGPSEGRSPGKGERNWEEAGAEAGAIKRLNELRRKDRPGEVNDEGGAAPNHFNLSNSLIDQIIKVNNGPAKEEEKANYIINTLSANKFPKEVTGAALQLLKEGYLSMDSMKKKDMIKLLEEELAKPPLQQEDSTHKSKPKEGFKVV